MQEKCPNCGYCPNCGRVDEKPIWRYQPLGGPTTATATPFTGLAYDSIGPIPQKPKEK
jgi:hypothetical protein